ncbi:ribonuclease PH [Enterococcus nangangensis]|uniref:ribonuclease PH n=1 Tax=Enterococcus nangangensis TaxID=2559926 RepID=UPI0010F5A211|nr:ribonuclease PH [Enterococcus nangangensis]
MRHDGRTNRQLREITIKTDILLYPAGSVEIQFGNTKVICTATIEEKVPPFLKGSGSGWVNADYNLLPFATQRRTPRERKTGVKGRTQEIQRLIARSLRQAVDLEKLGERTIQVDCDVIQADGGTRTTAITGGFVALALALRKLTQLKHLPASPLKTYVAAISCGLLSDGTVVVDLDYPEDVSAQVDFNLVMNEAGEFIEIQGTGEKTGFSGEQLNALLQYGQQAIAEIIQMQKAALLVDTSQQSSPQTIVVATTNPGKQKEFAALLAPLGFQVKTLLDYPQIGEVAETGQTFEENARLKAETIAAILQQPVIADDSGLMVAALDGLPGIYSARFAGSSKNPASNNAKLLAQLAPFPKGQRQAAFYCALAVAAPHKETLLVHGKWDGEIALIPKGEGGFGYDPLFYVPEYQQTAAELAPAVKNEISHRGKALKALQTAWPNWWKEEA